MTHDTALAHFAFFMLELAGHPLVIFAAGAHEGSEARWVRVLVGPACPLVVANAPVAVILGERLLCGQGACRWPLLLQRFQEPL